MLQEMFRKYFEQQTFKKLQRNLEEYILHIIRYISMGEGEIELNKWIKGEKSMKIKDSFSLD